MNFERFTSTASLTAVLTAGWALNAWTDDWVRPADRDSDSNSVLNVPAIGSTTRARGLRTVGAGVAWILVQRDWEQRDIDGTRRNLELSVGLDPTCLTFWINGARMLAYDMSAWRQEKSGGLMASADVITLIDRQQARIALAWLNRAQARFPQSVELVIERANIQLNRLRDVEAAAQSYREAAQMPDAPYFAARLHAELLRRTGRNRAAYDWLVQLHPTLPERIEEAGADLVLARIRVLERVLRIPSEAVYHAAAQKPVAVLSADRQGR